MMRFMDLVKMRRSVRSYLDREVEREKIIRCIEAARFSPSACNSQPWSFIIVDDPVLKNQVAQQTFDKLVTLNKFAKDAPAIVVILLEKSKLHAQIAAVIKKTSYNYIDLGIAAEHFCLQAVEEGLGTCMLGWFNENGIKKVLGLPKNKKIGLLITVGYPKTNKTGQMKRKEIDSMLSYNNLKHE